jgi:hypothetical protein
MRAQGKKVASTEGWGEKDSTEMFVVLLCNTLGGTLKDTGFPESRTLLGLGRTTAHNKSNITVCTH